MLGGGGEGKGGREILRKAFWLVEISDTDVYRSINKVMKSKPSEF